MARGVQGMMDFTVPGGASSSDDGTAAAVDDGVTEETRDCGSIKRILAWKNELKNTINWVTVILLMIQVIMELEMEALYIFERRHNLKAS
jgi:hypothetical protein